MPEKALKNVASKYHLSVEQVHKIIDLLDSGYSIPYIMRYHKELAAALEPEDFYELIAEKQRLEKLEARRRKILKKLEERGILDDGLQERISQARDMRELIDHYVPYRPRKRSASRRALSQGLEPLAREVLLQERFIPDLTAAAEPYVNPEVELENVEQVLEGVFHIVTDWIAEEKSHRDRQREVMREEGCLVTTRMRRSIPGRLVREFRKYFDFRQKISDVHPYAMLTVMRGKRLKVINYEIEPPIEAMEHAAAELYLAGGGSQLDQIHAELADSVLTDSGEKLKRLNSPEFLVACIKHSLRNILAGIIAREFERELQKKAEQFALDTIRRHVRGLLMTRPVAQVTMGIHPGYRTGCNVAVVDAAGDMLAHTTVYPHTPQNEKKAARETLAALIEEHGVKVISLGDGTASEETEDFLAELIAEEYPDLRYGLTTEVGLDAYAKSRAARNEMEDLEPGERCAAALARRLVDPLTEYIKINPRDICPEPYADEVNGGRLKTLLDRALEECVCRVGADANRAHYEMLRHVSGLGSDEVRALVEHRQQNGPFVNRLQVKNVEGISTAAYERSIGFLKVPGSQNPLDVTRIHPRYYPLAQDICNQLEIDLERLGTQEGREELSSRRSEIQLAKLEKEYDIHYLLLKDIIDEMINPWPDPRQEDPGPVLRQHRLTMQDLEPEQWVEGTVRNIVDFGAFVDIGVGEDGLVHISELADSFVESPYDVVTVGDEVRVKVLQVDRERGRIALSMREESRARETRERKPKRTRQEPTERAPRPAAEVPSEKPSTVRAPSSTVGSKSRRVQKVSQAAERLSKKDREMIKQSAAEEEPGPQETETAEERESVGGLLDKLDFANIERRGEPK